MPPTAPLLVVQSFRTTRVPRWVGRCLDSVAAWADGRGLAYRRLGDELFDLVPPEVADAVGRRLLPLTDVARLVLLRRCLDEGWGSVLWLDADVVVFAPGLIDLGGVDELSACHEPWVTGDGAGGLKVVRFVANAALLCRAPGDAVDDLVDATLERALAGRLEDRSLGPDLLTVLDRARPIPVVRGVTLFSPHVVRAVASGGGLAVAALRDNLPWPAGAANLCASTAVGDDVFERAVETLLATGGRVVNG